MHDCSICGQLQIAPATTQDYRQLAHYHYLDDDPGPIVAAFALKPVSRLARMLRSRPVGIIVYTLPIPEMRLRSLATRDFFSGFDRNTKISLINKTIRRIARVIVDPRFRALGLASRLVRETMPKLKVPIIEALAVMGKANPFFEKAGMQPFTAPQSPPIVEFVEVMHLVGIRETEFVDPRKVQEKLDTLSTSEAQLIESSAKRFLKGHGDRLNMPPGLDRTRYILSRIAFTPIYYIWFNPLSNVKF